MLRRHLPLLVLLLSASNAGSQHHHGAANLNHLALSRLGITEEQTRRAWPSPTAGLSDLAPEDTIDVLELLISDDFAGGLHQDILANAARRPEEVGKRGYKRIVEISLNLARSGATHVGELLGEALTIADELPEDEAWPVARRTFTAGLVLRRLKHGPLSAEELGTANAVLLRFFDAHRRAAQQKRVMEFLHVSKAGGTTFCQLAEMNGCRTKSFEYVGGNCLIPRFNDRPHWLDRISFDSVQLPGLPPANCDKVYFTRPIREVPGSSCFQRRRYMMRKSWNMYSNEYTAYGGEEGPAHAHLCHSRMLTVMQLRHPMSRIASNIKHMFSSISSRCRNGPALLGLVKHNNPHSSGNSNSNSTTNTSSSSGSTGSSSSSGGDSPSSSSGPTPRFANASFWAAMAPSVTSNYYTRVLLGAAVNALPAHAITEQHLRLARMMLVQFAVLLLLDDPDLESHTLKYGMGWPVHSAHANRRDSGGGRAEGLPDDMDWLEAVNHPDMELFKFGVVLARLDALMYDMAHEAGVDVGRAGSGHLAEAALEKQQQQQRLQGGLGGGAGVGTAAAAPRGGGGSSGGGGGAGGVVGKQGGEATELDDYEAPYQGHAEEDDAGEDDDEGVYDNEEDPGVADEEYEKDERYDYAFVEPPVTERGGAAAGKVEGKGEAAARVAVGHRRTLGPGSLVGMGLRRGEGAEAEAQALEERQQRRRLGAGGDGGRHSFGRYGVIAEVGDGGDGEGGGGLQLQRRKRRRLLQRTARDVAPTAVASLASRSRGREQQQQGGGEAPVVDLWELAVAEAERKATAEASSEASRGYGGDSGAGGAGGAGGGGGDGRSRQQPAPEEIACGYVSQ